MPSWLIYPHSGTYTSALKPRLPLAARDRFFVPDGPAGPDPADEPSAIANGSELSQKDFNFDGDDPSDCAEAGTSYGPRTTATTNSPAERKREPDEGSSRCQ